MPNETKKSAPTVIVDPMMVKRPDRGTLQQKNQNISTLVLIILVAIVVLAGVGTGFAIANSSGTSGQSSSPNGESSTKGAKTAGMLEKDVDYDETEGKLVKEGINGEGTHHLEREGGVSQNVYLTSSTINLDEYEGKTVKVWGITFAAQKAGWLMDVAKLEVQ